MIATAGVVDVEHVTRLDGRPRLLLLRGPGRAAGALARAPRTATGALAEPGSRVWPLRLRQQVVLRSRGPHQGWWAALPGGADLFRLTGEDVATALEPDAGRGPLPLASRLAAWRVAAAEVAGLNAAVVDALAGAAAAAGTEMVSPRQVMVQWLRRRYRLDDIPAGSPLLRHELVRVHAADAVELVLPPASAPAAWPLCPSCPTVRRGCCEPTVRPAP
jgi:hypothetical protein